jgi:hypothetical protein
MLHEIDIGETHVIFYAFGETWSNDAGSHAFLMRNAWRGAITSATLDPIEKTGWLEGVYLSCPLLPCSLTLRACV